MTYVVVRVGQLKEHCTESLAMNEAERLTSQTGKDFYIAEVQKLCFAEQVTRWTARWKSTCYPRNAGALWSKQDDKALKAMWCSGSADVSKLATFFERTQHSIECRLEMHGLNPY